MAVVMPAFVLERSVGSLSVAFSERDVALFVRDEEWGLRKYPQNCPVEMRVGTWEIDQVLLVGLLVRLLRSDAMTFDTWVNVSDAGGMRVMQSLANQTHVGVHLVTDRVARSLRVENPVRGAVGTALLRNLSGREAWTPTQYEAAMARQTQLYPTAKTLWWHQGDANQRGR